MQHSRIGDKFFTNVTKRRKEKIEQGNEKQSHVSIPCPSNNSTYLFTFMDMIRTWFTGTS